MRKPIIFATAGLTLAAVGGTAFAQATAQPPAPPASTEAAPAPAAPGPYHPWMRMGAWEHNGKHGPDRMGWHHRAMPFGPGTFGLFAHQTDKHLTTSDVQTIAQGILLMNGEHDWKVGQVEAAPNRQVTFAYTAQDGTVIAKFSIDQQTGRISRVG